MKKHRVAFFEASTVFADALTITIPDPDHSQDEERWVAIDLSNRRRVLVVVHAEEEETIRINSARMADRLERRKYEEGIRKSDEMRNHYDFSRGVRGKYTLRNAEGTNAVVLDPDVARLFPNGEAVNETLRAVVEIVNIQERRRHRANKKMEPTRKARRSSWRICTVV